ncbi:MAG: MlaD family protein [Myxococcota bacterium]
MSVDPKHAFRTGLVVMCGVGVALSFFFATRKSTLDASNSVPYFALLDDAAGINAKSLITVAGLQVGEIIDIRLVDTTEEELRGHLRLEVERAYQDRMLRWWEARRKRLLDSGKPDPGPLPTEAELPVHDERDGLFHGKPKPPPPWSPKRVVRVARVDMRIMNSVQLPKDSWLKKESLGLLGAKALFLELGTDDATVPPGGRIYNVRSSTQLDAITEQAGAMVASVGGIIDTIDRDLGGIVYDVHSITSELSRFVAGDEDSPPLDELYQLVMEEVRKVTSTVDRAVRQVDVMLRNNDKAVTGLLTNMERISGDLASLTGSPEVGDDGVPTGGELRETVLQVRKITQDLSTVTAALKDIVGANEEDFDVGVQELKHTLAELNRSLTSLAEVSGKVERGEGTVGRLLTDERIADKVESAVEGASDFVAGLTAIETHVDLGTWYNLNRDRAQVALELRIQPKPDKYYLIGIVDDGGGIERLTQSLSSQSPDGTVTRRSSIRENDNSVRLNAMFAKKFWDFLVLRAGLIETSGGLGANLFFWGDRIELRSDVFNFGGPRNLLNEDLEDPLYAGLAFWPRWRTMLKEQPIPHLYLLGGVDDVLNYDALPAVHGYGFDYFVGAGLTFQDEDLRTLLPFLPSF